MNSILKKVELSIEERKIAIEHAEKRTASIVRQFVPRNAPLIHLESNYVGVIGEMAVRKYLGINTELEDTYDEGNVDKGDIQYNGLIYDVKTDALMKSYYEKLVNKTLRVYEPYACRVFTAKHLHHLVKYTGGLIFCIFEIPNNAKETKKNGMIRDELINKSEVIIVGYVKQEDVTNNKPTWYTPTNPRGNHHKYNSANFIFTHDTNAPEEISKLRDIKEIL